MLTGFILSVLALEEKGSLISVNPGLIFWTVITFIVLMILLKKVAWKPILTALDQREAAIRESLEKAEKAREEAQKVLDENKTNIAQAEEESKKIIDQSRAYAEKLKEQIIRESKEQAKKIVDNAADEIERKTEAAFNDLKNQVAEIAINAAEKILKETLNKETNKKIVDKYIDNISRN
ncbi:MAG TPA: F0F1 ATP synthase subunit B [Ignavibacteriaceae bacterium]|nr:F0F1 ATP synthase subunit B [Ignavibacteriaceae bacterium]